MLETPKGQDTVRRRVLEKEVLAEEFRKRKVTILGMQQWTISRKPKE